MLADLEQFHAEEISGESGTKLMLGDREHADAVLVLHGELTLEGHDRAIDSDTWVYVPAGNSCELHVTGNAPARLLNIQVPATGGSEVVVRRAGGLEGDKITDRPPERRATVLVETEELTISEFDYGPGERGAPRHVHREHADAFLVVEGEFTFHLRDGSRSLGAGTLVVFPPGVVHGFDNDSSGHTRAFNFHMPSFGFADYMRGRNPDFDQFDPPDDGGLDPAAVVVAQLSD